MKTVSSSVAFQDEAGNPLSNGSLILSLPQGIYEIASGGGQVVGLSKVINLDGSGKIPASQQIWASDELTPQTPYSVTICSQPNGLQQVGYAKWMISGASPIDLSQMVPTSAAVSFPLAIYSNPSGAQVINGQPLTLEGALLGLSGAGVTTPDVGFSRLAAAKAALGNGTQGDITGELDLTTL